MDRGRGYALLGIILVLFLFAAAVRGDTESITMTAAPGYLDLRECAKYCFMENGRGNIASMLSCSRNICLCRTDLESSAHSWITSCIVTQQCQDTNTVDVSMGVSFFDGYCDSYRNPAESPATTTTTTTTNEAPTAAKPSIPLASSTNAATMSSFDTLPSPTPTFEPDPFPPSSRILSSSPIAEPSSTTTTPPPRTTAENNGVPNTALTRQDILTIVFGVLALFIALAVGIWQGRNKDSFSRRQLRLLLAQRGNT